APAPVPPAPGGSLECRPSAPHRLSRCQARPPARVPLWSPIGLGALPDNATPQRLWAEVHHASSGASAHHRSRLAPSLRGPRSLGHRGYHYGGRAIAEGGATNDGPGARRRVRDGCWTYWTVWPGARAEWG